MYRRDTLLKLASLPTGRLEEAEKLEQLRALEHGIAIRVWETNTCLLAGGYAGRCRVGGREAPAV